MAEGIQFIWTPWREHRELLQNRAWLFPDHNGYGEGKESRRKACDQISVWKLRGNLPHAVESTWLLTEAILTDEIPANSIPLFAVKSSYITAINRFVTGLLDLQQESKYKVSMYAKAQEIGLPALFVDLRHEAVHGDMPSLNNLRGAAQKAMQWLWDDYWKGLGKLDKAESGTDLWNQTGSTSEGDVEAADAQEVLDGDDVVQGESWTKWQGYWKARPIGTVV